MKFLLNGEICLVYVMIELNVVLFDVKNILICVVLDGDDWVINGEKFYIFGVGNLCCKVMIVMVKINLDVLVYK